jgi:voltage-gated potassium channel Kch
MLVLATWVALVSLVILLVLSMGIHFSGLYPDMGLPEMLWTMLMQALAPNPVSFSGPAIFLAAMLLITLLGLFMVSIFIGIIATAIDEKVQSLRKGRSQVLEKDHTVILGWDEHIFTIISELVITNQARRRACVVILGEKDKVEMEDEIKARVGPTGRTEIVCRSGSPIDMADLEILSVNTARSIIILAPDGEDPDTYIIKALLAIMNNPHRRQQPYHIVTEIQDAANMDTARLVGKDEAIILLISDVIAHIIAQTCRQSGLSVVYTELMNFEGDEIYFQEEPTLVGRTFGDVLWRFEDSTVIGICPKGGAPKLNPPMDTPIGAGDQLIVISEEQDTIRLSTLAASPVQAQRIQVRQTRPAAPEATLILGWNVRGCTIIRELDNYVAAGSRVKVVANEPGPEAEVLGLLPDLKNQAVAFLAGNTTDRRLLTTLCAESYDHVIVLADLEGESNQMADAHTLISLLNLRDIDQKIGNRFSIVSEMLDVRNRNLAEVTHADDFIVSDELASLLMAQISENKELSPVFQDLFNSEGSEIYLKPVGDYVSLDRPVNFYTVVEAARLRSEVALGYRIAEHAGSDEKAYGVAVNPDKSSAILFREGDKVIVLAES